MSESVKVSTVLNATAKEIYTAWLDSKGHAAFTGSAAKVSAKKGSKFTAWDGYISGKNVALKPYTRIVQKWRTTEFPEGSPDSNLEILLEQGKKGTKLTLIHTEIPDGQAKEYKKGWVDFYFKPMKEYFKGKSNKT